MSTVTEARFELGDFELQSGITLTDAFLGYATHGKLNAARDNVIVFPTWYTGHHADAEPYIGPDMALDPERYLIVVPDMFTNGLSTSGGALSVKSGTSSPYVVLDNVSCPTTATSLGQCSYNFISNKYLWCE